MSESSAAAKYIREKAKLAKAQGWTVEDSKKGVKFTPADKIKSQVHVHKSPSDNRWMKNKDADFKHSGLRF